MDEDEKKYNSNKNEQKAQYMKFNEDELIL